MASSDKQTPDSRILSPKVPEALAEPRTGGVMLGSKTCHDPKTQKRLESKHWEISGEIQSLTRATSRLKQQNRYLKAEAETTQRNVNQYMVYLSHRTERRHNTIITLNDYNHQKLQTIKREKEEAVQAMQEREAQLRTEILGKEHTLSTVVKELEELRPYREKQAEYLTRIVELKSELTKRRAIYREKETMVTRIFYQDLESRCKEYAEEVAQFYKRATTKADLALQVHVQWAKQENAGLRTQLLRLVWHLDKLNEKKRKLQRHNQVLLWDMQGQKAIPHIAHHQRHAGCLRQVKGENKINQQKVWLDNSQCTDRMRPEEHQTNGGAKYPQCTPQPQPETPQTNGGAKYPQSTPQPQPETPQTNGGAKYPQCTPQPQPEMPQTSGVTKYPQCTPQLQPETPQTNGGAKYPQCTPQPQPEIPQTNGGAKYPQCTPQPPPETPKTNGGAKYPQCTPQPQPETPKTNGGAKYPQCTPQPQPKTPQTNGGAKYPQCTPQPQLEMPQTNGGAKYPHCTPEPQLEMPQTNGGAKYPQCTPQPQPEMPQTNGGAKYPHRTPETQLETPQINGGAKCPQCTSKPEQIPNIRDPELHHLHTKETLTLALGGHKKEGNNEPME